MRQHSGELTGWLSRGAQPTDGIMWDELVGALKVIGALCAMVATAYAVVWFLEHVAI